jgi:hypothetical protein
LSGCRRVRTGEAGQERMVGGWNRQGEVRILANMFFPEVYDLEGD